MCHPHWCQEEQDALPNSYVFLYFCLFAFCVCVRACVCVCICLCVCVWPVKPDLPVDYEAQTWKELEAAVLAVQTQRPVSTSLEQLYHYVENLCSHKMAAKLYSQLQAVCKQHVQAQLQRFAGYVYTTWRHHSNNVCNVGRCCWPRCIACPCLSLWLQCFTSGGLHWLVSFIWRIVCVWLVHCEFYWF